VLHGARDSMLVGVRVDQVGGRKARNGTVLKSGRDQDAGLTTASQHLRCARDVLVHHDVCIAWWQNRQTSKQLDVPDCSTRAYFAPMSKLATSSSNILLGRMMRGTPPAVEPNLTALL
jgi:hypothetical protein